MNKSDDEPLEIFVPERGLDVRSYIDDVLPADASAKEQRSRKQAIHALGRYTWASMVLRNTPPGRVLDVGCGSGFGASMLARALPQHQVVAGDKDERAIAFARSRYGDSPNLSFSALDIEVWNDLATWQPLGAFDYVVCFETIEKLLHRELALINLTENLSPAGLLLLTTPSGKRENLLNPGWERNKVEYAHRYLINLMRRFFGEVRIPDDETLPELAFWRNVINRGEQRYLLRGTPMVCSQPIQFSLNI